MVEGRHVGRGDLLRPSAAHRVYALEAHSRRHGPNRRRGTYHAYPPTDHTPDTGDIIIQDRKAQTPAAVLTFANIAALAQGRDTHGDIVVEVAPNHVVAVGGNVGNSVRRRRYPLDGNRRLVVEAGRLYTQETNAGDLPLLPANSNEPLHGRSTARIFTLLRPVEVCVAIPGQSYHGGVLT